jgi:hypothetical protein
LSLNLYTYVENNPLIYSDPTGHAKFDYNQSTYLANTAAKSEGHYIWAVSWIMDNSFLDENQTKYLLNMSMGRHYVAEENSAGNASWAKSYLANSSQYDWLIWLNNKTKFTEAEAAHIQQAASGTNGYDVPDENVYPVVRPAPSNKTIPEVPFTPLKVGFPNPSANHVITNDKSIFKTTGSPSSTMDFYNGTDLMTRRYYGADGRATMDIDYTNHGNAKMHPFVPHFHTWFWDGDTPTRK